jgi:hypothetical protein
VGLAGLLLIALYLACAIEIISRVRAYYAIVCHNADYYCAFLADHANLHAIAILSVLAFVLLVPGLWLVLLRTRTGQTE